MDILDMNCPWCSPKTTQIFANTTNVHLHSCQVPNQQVSQSKQGTLFSSNTFDETETTVAHSNTGKSVSFCFGRTELQFVCTQICVHMCNSVQFMLSM